MKKKTASSKKITLKMKGGTYEFKVEAEKLLKQIEKSEINEEQLHAYIANLIKINNEHVIIK